MFSNETKVTVGVVAGAIASGFVIIMNKYVGLVPPIDTELQAIITILTTATAQWILPLMEKKDEVL